MLVYQTVPDKLRRLEQFLSPFKMTKTHGAKKWLVQTTSACPGHAESISAFLCPERDCQIVDSSLQTVFRESGVNPKSLSRMLPSEERYLTERSGSDPSAFHHFPQESGESGIHLNCLQPSKTGVSNPN